MTAANQTIVIKKKDGTKVRLTLAEFKEYKKKLNIGKTVPETTKVDQPPVEKEAVEQASVGKKLFDIKTKKEQLEKETQNLPVATTHDLSRTTPVKDIFIDEAKAKQAASQWTAGDEKSLLEEAEEDLLKHQALPSLPEKHEDVFSQVLRGINFPISDEIQSRLRSLVLSRVKDVRNNEQVLAKAMQAYEKGGLGWDQDKAQSLVQAIAPVLKTATVSRPGKKVQKVVKLKAAAKVDAVKQSLSAPLQSKLLGRTKPVLHDVTAASLENLVKRGVGPIEELKMFSLTDWRRLAVDTDQALEVLKDKFKVLQAESYVLYLQALVAWQHSPLYQKYLEIIRQSVNQQQKVQSLLSGQDANQLKEKDFFALVKLHQYLK